MSKIEITLQDIFLALKRYLVWICLTTFLFTAGALVYAFVMDNCPPAAQPPAKIRYNHCLPVIG